MKTIQILTLIICTVLAMSKSTQGQEKSIFHISIQGTWDKTKHKERAQYGGDNRLINTYLASYRKDFFRLGPAANGIGSISFKVRSDGAVDSLVIIEKAGGTWDSTFYYLVKSMSGKWRAGEVDGIKKNETITIWYNIYNGPILKKGPAEFLEEAKKSWDKSDYERVLKYIDIVLEYDALNIEALILKTKSLYSLNQKIKACDFIKSTLKYEDERLTNASKEFCE